jgi:26S proteasome regulatory subunit N3
LQTQSQDIDMDSSSTPSAVTSSSTAATATAAPKVPKIQPTAAVELEIYLAFLALSYVVHDQKARKAAAAQLAAQAASWIEYATSFNSRTLDIFTARLYAFFALAHKEAGTLPQVRTALMSAYRTAALRHDEFGQGTLMNLILESFVEAKEFDQANKFIGKATFPAASSNNQLVRNLYYKGLIHAVQLDYTDAYAALNQASRKAPPTARCFQAKVTKWIVVVQLLMGEIPERTTFTAKDAAAGLEPYHDLVGAVRVGDVQQFARVLQKEAAAFARDGTYNVIRRLEASVIKAGLRKIAASYSRISFANIAHKLGLASGDDAEFLCAKVRVHAL